MQSGWSALAMVVGPFFDLCDEHFGSASPEGLFGRQQDAFWTTKQSCSKEYRSDGETREYLHCKAGVKLTLYGPGQHSGIAINADTSLRTVFRARCRRGFPRSDDAVSRRMSGAIVATCDTFMRRRAVPRAG